MIRINSFLNELKSTNTQQEIFSLCCLVLVLVNNNDSESLYYLSRNYYVDKIRAGWGFSDAEKSLVPSIVELGEISELAYNAVTRVKKGEISKEEALSDALRYFEEYIL